MLKASDAAERGFQGEMMGGACSESDLARHPASGGRPLVSVIVPFYNIAGSVRSCLDSITAQTYSDLEIICIDDGSTDETPALLDGYARADARIRVVHVENGGLGAARNRGVAESRGQVITFVDGDDLIAPYAVEVLVDTLIGSGCALAVARHRVVRQQADTPLSADTLFPACVPDYPVRACDREQSVRALLYEDVTEGAWARAFTRELIAAHPFPEQRFYEDTAWAGRLFADVAGIAVADVPIYGYVMRADSIAHRKQATMKQAHDFLWAISEMIEPLLTAYPDTARAAAFRFCLEYARVHALLGVAQPADEAARLDRWVIGEIAALLPIVLEDAQVGLMYKARFALLRSAPHLYDRVFGIYERLFKGLI